MAKKRFVETVVGMIDGQRVTAQIWDVDGVRMAWDGKDWYPEDAIECKKLQPTR